MPELIALSRSGDAFVTNDNGRFLLHLPAAQGGIRSLTAVEADRYVTDAGLRLIGQQFESWSSIDEFVRSYGAENVPAPEIDPDRWDEHEVRDMLAAAQRMVERDESAKAQGLLNLLLALRLVRGDDELHRLALTQLDSLTRPATPAPPFSSDRAPAEAAQARWRELAAA